MKTLVVVMVLIVSYLFGAAIIPSVTLKDLKSFNKRQRQMYQAYIKLAFPIISVESLLNIDESRKKLYLDYSELDGALNNYQSYISNTLDIIDMASSKYQYELEMKQIEFIIKEGISEEFGDKGNLAIQITDSTKAILDCAHAETKGCILGATDIVNNTVSNVAKLYNAVDYWANYGDITKKQNSYLMLRIYIYTSIKKGNFDYVNDDLLENIASRLDIDISGWWDTDLFREYNEEFTKRLFSRFRNLILNNYSDMDGKIFKKTENLPPQIPKLEIIGGIQNTSLTPILEASGYEDPDGDYHYQTWWGIYGKRGLIWESKWSSSNKYKLTLPIKLKYNTNYKIAVAFKDNKNNFSKAKFIYFKTKDKEYSSIYDLPQNYFNIHSSICAKCQNTNNQILILQELLNNFDNLKTNLDEDGIWGVNTMKALMKFQAYYGLTIDGIAGKNTKQKLTEVLKALQGYQNMPREYHYPTFIYSPFGNKYNYKTAPISSVYDHSSNNDGLVIAFDGTVAQKKYGKDNGSCYKTKSRDSIILENVNYVGKNDDSYLCYDASPNYKDNGYHRHTGIDYSVPIGTKIYASASGNVVDSKIADGYGEYIKIYHDNNSYATYYAHLSKRYVGAGQYVKKGALIGLSGNSGNVSPHLHFEVRKGCNHSSKECLKVNRIDPYGFMGIGSLWKTDENLNAQVRIESNNIQDGSINLGNLEIGSCKKATLSIIKDNDEGVATGNIELVQNEDNAFTIIGSSSFNLTNSGDKKDIQVKLCAEDSKYYGTILKINADNITYKDDKSVVAIQGYGIGDGSPNTNNDLYFDKVTVNDKQSGIIVNAGDRINLYAKERYNGDKTGEVTNTIGYYFSKDNSLDKHLDIKIGEDEASPDSKFGHGKREYYTIPKNTPSGTYYVIFVADDGSVVDETNEDNNLEYVKIKVETNIQNSSNDFSVSNFSISKNNLKYNEIYDIDVTFAYQGNSVNALHPKATMYISKDTKIDASDKKYFEIFGGFNLSKSNHGSHQNYHTRTYVKVPAGDYYLIMKINDPSKYYETNFDNNIKFVPVTILGNDTDADTDNDGISDKREIELGLNPNSNDSDVDGILDSDEIGDINNPTDTDGDGIIDALDTDSDNDGISDADELKAGTNPRDPNSKPSLGKVTLGAMDDVYMPINAPTKALNLHISNTTDEPTTISTHSYNTDLVVTSDTNPLYITPVHNAKGHTQVSVRVSAGGKSNTKAFKVYIGEKKPRTFVPIIMDDIVIMVPKTKE